MLGFNVTCLRKDDSITIGFSFKMIYVTLLFNGHTFISYHAFMLEKGKLKSCSWHWREGRGVYGSI